MGSFEWSWLFVPEYLWQLIDESFMPDGIESFFDIQQYKLGEPVFVDFYDNVFCYSE